MKDPLLLHSCCAPCFSYVFELLREEYDVTAFFFNPNIAPSSEYVKRLNEMERFSSLKGFTLLTGPYSIREWTLQVKPYRFYGEGSVRCRECFRIRLEASFRKAVELGIGCVATTLSISPHKNAGMINSIGSELSEKYGISFLEADFKKKDGFRKSVEMSREHGFYRQNYCGCIYSKLERNRDRLWPGSRKDEKGG